MFGDVIHSFTTSYVGLWGELAVGDVDNDGHVDVVSPATSLGPNVNGIAVMRGDGTGRFSSYRWYRDTEYGVQAVFLADVDDDGTLDIVSRNSGYITAGIKRGAGDGTFAPMELFGIPGPAAITVGNVTGDDKPDLVVASRAEAVGGGRIFVLENVDGAFTAGQPFGDPQFWAQAVLADLDADGHDDVVGVDEDGQLIVSLMTCTARP